jgi:hypothetical protein
VDAIASLPLMGDFQLAIDDAEAAIPLDRLFGLRKFVVRGPLAPSVLGNLAEVIGNSPNLSHRVPDSSTFSTPCIPFSKTPSTTSLPLRHLAVRASQLDLNPIRDIIGLNSFNLEYTGLDTSIWLGRVFFAGVLLSTMLILLSQLILWPPAGTDRAFTGRLWCIGWTVLGKSAPEAGCYTPGSQYLFGGPPTRLVVLGYPLMTVLNMTMTRAPSTRL